MTIPKIIHYCWFGGNQLPKLAQKCIASWQKFLPDYQIKRWDETNFNLQACAYVQEAYQAKKYAFVSDYARFAILHKYGGLYFDTDVELIRPLDNILSRGAFMGLQSDFDSTIGINPGLGLAVAPGLGLAVAPGLGLYKELLDAYHERHFLNVDGTYNVTTVVTDTTEIIKKYGLENKPGIQHVAGITIYPKEYFCPKDYVTGKLTTTSNTVAIHHYTASWHSPREAYAHQLQGKLVKFFPSKLSGKISFVLSKIKYEGIRALLRYVICKNK